MNSAVITPLSAKTGRFRPPMFSVLIVLFSAVLGSPASEPRFRKTNSEPLVAEKPPVRLYDGLTLSRWREKLKTLGPGVPGVVEAIPGLTQITGDRTVPGLLRAQTALILGRLGQPALPALPTLEQLLQEPAIDGHDPAVWGAKAIALLGPQAAATTVELERLLNDPRASIQARTAVVEALAKIGGAHPRAIPAIVGLLQSSLATETAQEERELLRAAADGIAIVGSSAGFAVPTILLHIRSEDDILRAKLVSALAAIGPAASPAAPALAETLLFDESREVRRNAATALANVGTEGHQLLSEFAHDEEVEVRQLAMQGLGTIQPRTKDVRRALEQGLSNPDEPTRVIAASVLWSPERTSESLPILVRALFSKDRTTRIEAAKILERTPPAVEVLDRLVEEVPDRANSAGVRVYQNLRNKLLRETNAK